MFVYLALGCFVFERFVAVYPVAVHFVVVDLVYLRVVVFVFAVFLAESR